MTDTTRRRRGGRLVAISALLLVALVAGGAYWFFTYGPVFRLISPPGSTVAELRGTDDLTTGFYRLRDGWEVHWESRGDRFEIAITGERELGELVHQQEPASGVVYPVGAGRFRLDIAADGAWTVKILQGN